MNFIYLSYRDSNIYELSFSSEKLSLYVGYPQKSVVKNYPYRSEKLSLYILKPLLLKVYSGF